MGKFTRQDFAVLVAIGVWGLATLLVAVWPHLLSTELKLVSQKQATIAYTLLLLAVFATCLNIRTACIRPLLYYFRHRSFVNYKGESCIPGSVGMLLLPGALLAPPSTTLGLVILFLGLINPGGMHLAFLTIILMLRDARSNRVQS